MKVSALVFAAGLGTRLYPLTADRPKALVRYDGVPLLKIVLDKIIASGIHDVVVNVHHFPDQIIDFLKRQDFDARIQVSDERAYLRDTAGGLKFAEHLFGEAQHILLYNVDILSSLSIVDMVHQHLSSGADATLAVRQRKTSRYLVFDESNMRLRGWHNVSTGDTLGEVGFENAVELAFSGIHVVRRELARAIPSVEKQSLTPFYVHNADRLLINGYRHKDGEWMDVGKYSEYENVLS
ncbi:MAG: NTP transferase domain-containing protein [Bacteroidales bacterium]|nr:NTP transferase domain-containing protein [Bacteroidales bacterium]